MAAHGSVQVPAQVDKVAESNTLWSQEQRKMYN